MTRCIHCKQSHVSHSHAHVVEGAASDIRTCHSIFHHCTILTKSGRGYTCLCRKLDLFYGQHQRMFEKLLQQDCECLQVDIRPQWSVCCRWTTASNTAQYHHCVHMFWLRCGIIFLWLDARFQCKNIQASNIVSTTYNETTGIWNWIVSIRPILWK